MDGASILPIHEHAAVQHAPLASIVPACDAGPPHPRSGGSRGSVVVSRGPRGSLVTRAYAESPLKWLTPRAGGDAAWVFASSYGGGLVGGDRLAIDVRVDAGAGALLSTQASTKVYRSPRGVETRLTAAKESGNTMTKDGEEIQLGIPEQMRAMAAMIIPIGRPASPEEAAGPVFFLCSPWSNYVHGQVLNVTGGQFTGMTM